MKKKSYNEMRKAYGKYAEALTGWWCKFNDMIEAWVEENGGFGRFADGIGFCAITCFGETKRVSGLRKDDSGCTMAVCDDDEEVFLNLFIDTPVFYLNLVNACYGVRGENQK